MKSWLKILIIVLGLGLIAGLIFGLRFYRRINEPAQLFEMTPSPLPAQSLAPVISAEESPSPEPTPSPLPTPQAEELLSAQADMDFMKNRVNVLALGIDESAERADWGSYRTDTMMLISVDFSTNEVALVSIPRDSYVKIYNSEGEIAKLEEPMAKINTAFSAGGGAKRHGFEYACMTVSKLLDVPVQHYVCVNMPVVKQMVDAMGGVDYEMDVAFTMNGRSYSMGMQHMNGQAVLDYCRLRKDSSDIVRVERQQKMLSLILDTMKSSDQIRNIPAMYKAAQANIETDMSFEQICALALMGAKMDMGQLSSHTVPVTAMKINERSCVAVKTLELAEMVKKVFGKKEVNIDPEIDADFLSAMPALVMTDESLVMPDGTVQYYQADGRYFVLVPGSNNEYQGMSEEEFNALTGRRAG